MSVGGVPRLVGFGAGPGVAPWRKEARGRVLGSGGLLKIFEGDRYEGQELGAMIYIAVRPRARGRLRFGAWGSPGVAAACESPGCLIPVPPHPSSRQPASRVQPF